MVIKPFAYQLEAIDAVKTSNWSGILEMATGTGKTYTSLLIADRFFQEQEKIFLVILIPFVHLAEQWKKSCFELGFENCLFCYGGKKQWIHQLRMDVRDYNLGFICKNVAITTYKTATSPEFYELVSRLKGNGFLIADECHYFGIKGLREHPFNSFIGRVGLSATPDRWWDEIGTKFLRDYFGKTVYEYDMRKAIQNDVLTEYLYYPHIVDLSSEEVEKYEKLTRRLVYLMQNQKSNVEEINEVNRKRSLVLSKAESKLLVLLKILSKRDKRSISHTLVYCAPGQVELICRSIIELGIRAHRFDSKVSLKERMTLLESFDSGHIQILVAIKCLDEGVDVPSTKEAFFLASTSNTREFIQRRGRVLRKHSKKNLAIIHDFIVLPNTQNNKLYKTIATKEIPRFAEFSQYAINNYESRNIVGANLKKYSLDYLMDKLPWEVYKELDEKEII